MKNYLSILSICLFSLSCTNVISADAELGRAQAASCTACHGYRGITVNPEWPNLAGQKQAYLVQQMKWFRDGDRYDPVMSGMLENYPDEVIENIAAFFSSLPVK